MNKKLRALVDQEILTLEDAIEYEELMICERFFSLINEQIEIAREPEPVEKKHYYFDTSTQRFRVRFTVDGIRKSFGSFKTEQKVIDRLEELKKEGVL